MTIEVTAKKVDDAIKQGLEQLGATLDDVKVEVLESGGLFRKAKVRLTLDVPEAKPAPAPEKKNEPEAKAEAKHEAKAEAKHEAKAEAKPEVKKEPVKQEAKPAPAPEKKPQAAEPKKEAPAQKKPVKVKNEQAPAVNDQSAKSQGDLSAQESQSEKPKKSAPKKDKSQNAEQKAPTATDATNAEEKSQVPDTDSTDHSKKGKRRLRAEDREAASHALEFVKKTVELMGFDTATVAADEDVEHVEITAPEGDDSLLIGRHGETLSALTYLAETCARAEKCHVNIVVDCNGYRARRAASLTSMAKRRARESAQKHRRIKLEPMDRTDRRTIHCALADDEYVTTASEGKEPYRYVVITPKDGVAYDYDDTKRDRRDRRDRNGKGGRGNRTGGTRTDTTPTGAKPRFDINLHGFVGHNDPVSDEQEQVEEKTEE